MKKTLFLIATNFLLASSALAANVNCPVAWSGSFKSNSITWMALHVGSLDEVKLGTIAGQKKTLISCSRGGVEIQAEVPATCKFSVVGEAQIKEENILAPHYREVRCKPSGNVKTNDASCVVACN